VSNRVSGKGDSRRGQEERRGRKFKGSTTVVILNLANSIIKEKKGVDPELKGAETWIQKGGGRGTWLIHQKSRQAGACVSKKTVWLSWKKAETLYQRGVRGIRNG